MITHPHEVRPVADPLGNIVEHGGVTLALVVQQHVEAILGKEADDVDKAAEHRVVGQVVIAAAWWTWVGRRDLSGNITCIHINHGIWSQMILARSNGNLAVGEPIGFANESWEGSTQPALPGLLGN